MNLGGFTQSMSVEVGQIVKGTVTGITKFGAFIKLEGGKSGMVHISEISNSYVSDIKDCLSEGQEITAKVISIDDKGRISLSIKKALIPAEPPKKTASFEDMLQKFKQDSEAKFSEVKGQKEDRKATYEKRMHK